MNNRLTQAVRNIHQLTAELEAHEKAAITETNRLRAAIAENSRALLLEERGLDIEKVTLAETILSVTDYSKGGTERNSARQDAIKWFATGKAGYSGLKYEYFGTKSYDRWHGQRCDCEYGYGPRHGSIIFEIGLKPEARRRELTDAEREAAIYYLVNLERIQSRTEKTNEQ